MERLLNTVNTFYNIEADTYYEKFNTMYRTRCTLHHIKDGIYIGGYLASINDTLLEANNISCVLSLLDNMSDISNVSNESNVSNDTHHNIEEIELDQVDLRSEQYMESSISPKCEIKRTVIHVHDSKDYKINKHFMECYKIIKKAMDDEQKILVNCSAGVSRSVTIVIMFLMVQYNMSYNEAFNLVKSNRKQAFPNAGFVEQLKKLEPRF